MWNFSIIYFILCFSAVYSQTNNATNCNPKLKVLPSDPAYQSPVSSVIIGSSVDYSEYLCQAGIGYDGTGISCYTINCQAPSYGPYGGAPGYGALYNQNNQVQPTSVGALAGQVETAHPCWKLRQLRLNNYVYLVCFVKNYASIIFQVAFKENGQVQLAPTESIAYNGLTSVGKAQFNAENAYGCLVAVYSSNPVPHIRDKKREPSDLLAPVYVICPNNYRWYFCGNVDIQNTIDVVTWNAQNSIHTIFVKVESNSPSEGVNCPPNNQLTPLVQYTMSANIETYECPSKLEEKVTAIGPNDQYTLCGIRQCTVVVLQNATFVCCAVYADDSCPTSGRDGYSSFCTSYNLATSRINKEKVVFLEGSDRSHEVQYSRAHGECCQYIITANPTGRLQVFSLSSIVAALTDQTAPATVAPMDLGHDHLFSNAVSCTFKSKCCNSQQTCVSCVRPAKYGDKYFAALTCGQQATPGPNPNEDQAVVYPMPPVRLPGNYSAPYGQPAYQAPPQQPYGAPYAPPVAAPYVQQPPQYNQQYQQPPPQQQHYNPVHGRY